MAVRPLKETHEVIDLSKQIVGIEQLREPALGTDYGVNSLGEVFRINFDNYRRDIFGLLLTGGFDVVPGSTSGTVSIGQGGNFFAGYYIVRNVDIVDQDISADIPAGSSGILYLRITERRFISSDGPDPDYGGIDPSVDLRFTAGSSGTFDTHNEYRFKYEFIATQGSVPSDTDDNTNKVYTRHYKVADVSADGSGNISTDVTAVNTEGEKLSDLFNFKNVFIDRNLNGSWGFKDDTSLYDFFDANLNESANNVSSDVGKQACRFAWRVVGSSIQIVGEIFYSIQNTGVKSVRIDYSTTLQGISPQSFGSFLNNYPFPGNPSVFLPDTAFFSGGYVQGNRNSPYVELGYYDGSDLPDGFLSFKIDIPINPVL